MEHAEILLVVGPLIQEGTELLLNCYFWSGILQYKHTCSIKPKYLVNCFKKSVSGETRCTSLWLNAIYVLEELKALNVHSVIKGTSQYINQL